MVQRPAFVLVKRCLRLRVSPAKNNAISFKCTPERSAELIEKDGIIPASYVARYHWVAVQKPDALAESELKELISKSYQMVVEKLSPKVRKSLAK